MVDLPGYSLSGAVATVFFITMTVKQPDNLRVTGPAHPVLARVKEDALLTCQLLSKRPTRHMEVRWYRSEPGTPIFVHQDGAEVTEMQMEEYGGRVEWIENGAAEGSVALRIHDIRPSDNGQYWCRFQDGNYWEEASLLLQVGGVGSAPDIHVEGSVENGVQLVCTARGWFPEPQVHWKDNQGEELLTASEHHFQDEDGLFYVETTLVLRNVSAETVSCVIHNPVLNEEKRSVISLPEKLQSELASLKVIGSSHPILVKVGEDTQLNCSLSPKANARGMEVRWVRSHRYPAVHVDVDGEPVAGEQMAEYRGRTTLVSDAIDEGRLTLQIRSATTSDAGQYRCLFEKDGVFQEASLDLKVVGLGSNPLITKEGLKDGKVDLMCTSDGWFPEPHVQWRDMEGRMIPPFSVALSQGRDGLFHVKTSLLVTDSSVVNVACAITNPLLNEEKNATLSVSESRMPFLMPILCILVLLLVLSLIWRKKHVKVNVKPNSSTAYTKLIPSEADKGVTHGHLYDQTSHRDSTTRSPSWPTRAHNREVILEGRCLGQKGIDHEFCQGRCKTTISLSPENEL